LHQLVVHATQVLGYKNVKSYDGSFMEWARDPNAPME